MPPINSAEAIPTEPWQVHVLKVDEDQPRIRLPKRMSTAVSWLTSENGNLPCLSMVGVRGGLLVCPVSALSLRSRVLKKLSLKPLRQNISGSELADYVRYSATSWALNISVESSRFTIHLPEEARKMGLVPGNGERAVVFGAGEIVEVWALNEWLTHLRRIGGGLGQLEKRVLDQLGPESPED